MSYWTPARLVEAMGGCPTCHEPGQIVSVGDVFWAVCWTDRARWLHTVTMKFDGRGPGAPTGDEALDREAEAAWQEIAGFDRVEPWFPHDEPHDEAWFPHDEAMA